MSRKIVVLTLILFSFTLGTVIWSEDELKKHYLTYQPQWVSKPEGRNFSPRRFNYLKRIKWLCDFLARYQVADSTSPDFGGIIEAEHLPTIIETDNTQEAIWVWSRWRELTGSDEYTENIHRAWEYVLSHPAYQEHGSNPASLWYAVWNCGLGFMAEARYRKAFGDSSYLSYADSCRQFYIANRLNEANFLDNFVTAQAAGMAYDYALERNDPVLRDTALARGTRVKNWIAADARYRLSYQTWAMCGATAFWGVAKTYCQADTVAGRIWLETYTDSLPGFYPAGNWNCSHNIWLAYAYRASAEITGTPLPRLMHHYLTDTLLMKDTDLDGGIPATWTDPNTQDQTWVSTYLHFMGMDGLIDTIYSQDIAVYEFLSPAPTGLYIEPYELIPVFRIENVGTTPISGTVYCQVGSQEQTQFITNLPVWDEETLSFDFPSPLTRGVHHLTAFFTNDENPANDSVFLTLKVYGKFTLTGTLIDSFTGEPVSARVKAYLLNSPLPWDSSATNVAGEFSLNLIDSTFIITIEPQPPYYRRSWTVAIPGDTNVLLRTRPADLIVVNNDTADTYTGYYTSTLDTLNLTWCLWKRRALGPISYDLLNRIQQNTVIWFSGNSQEQTVPAGDQETLARFINAGGNLLITGQNIAEELAGSTFLESILTCRFDSSGYSGFLVFGSRQDSIGRVVTGTATAGGGGANNQTSRDIISPLNGAYKLLVYDTVANFGAGIRRELPAGGRVIFLGFGFEAVNRPASRPNYFTRVQLMNTMLNWLITGTGITEPAIRQPLSTSRSFNVLPRIFRNSLIITTSGAHRINLFDISGRRITWADVTPGRTVWNLSLLPAGIYFIPERWGGVLRVVKVD